MEFFKPGRQFDFMSQRVFWIPFSIFVVIASTISLWWPVPNYGTEFRGGTEIEVAFNRTVDTHQLRQAIQSLGYHTPDVVQVQDAKNPNHFLIRVQEISVLNDTAKEQLKKALCVTNDPSAVADEKACPENARATELKFSPGGDKIATRYDVAPDLEKIKEQVRSVPGINLRASPTNPNLLNPRDNRVEIQLQSKGDQLMDGLRSKLGADAVPEQALRVEWVGPKAGQQLRDSARNSIAIAIVFIMLYLAFRFDLRFAPGVVLACLHDAMIILGVFVVLQREITISTIGAVLTVIGYSMNDTVVVYDRIRENLSKHRGKSFWDVINLSVSETLSRTILTTVSTLLSVIAFLVYGTGVIRDFALAMVIGIVAGTYSSIYVAAPLTEWIDRRMGQRAGAGKKKRASSKRRAKAATTKPAEAK